MGQNANFQGVLQGMAMFEFFMESIFCELVTQFSLNDIVLILPHSCTPCLVPYFLFSIHGNCNLFYFPWKFELQNSNSSKFHLWIKSNLILPESLNFKSVASLLGSIGRLIICKMREIVSVVCCFYFVYFVYEAYNAFLFVYYFTDLLTPASFVITLNEVNLPFQFATVVVAAAAIENYI